MYQASPDQTVKMPGMVLGLSLSLWAPEQYFYQLTCSLYCTYRLYPKYSDALIPYHKHPKI